MSSLTFPLDTVHWQLHLRLCILLLTQEIQKRVRLSPCHGESHHPMKESDLDTKRKQHTIIPAITDPDLNASDGVPEKLSDLPKVTELRWQSKSKPQTSATKAHAPSSTPPCPAEHERRVRRGRGQHGLEASGRASWRRGSSSWALKDKLEEKKGMQRGRSLSQFVAPRSLGLWVWNSP